MGDLTDNHGYGYSHTAYARSPSHNLSIKGYSVKHFHSIRYQDVTVGMRREQSLRLTYLQYNAKARNPKTAKVRCATSRKRFAPKSTSRSPTSLKRARSWG